MARETTKAARAERIETPATACLVSLSNMQWEDADNFSMDFLMVFNGLADNYGGQISFARNASQANKTTQVRQLVNATLKGLEPGASNLNNANIQIVGLPV